MQIVSIPIADKSQILVGVNEFFDPKGTIASGLTCQIQAQQVQE